MIISTDTEKTFDNIQHHFIRKTSRKPGTEGNVLNMIKSIYEKSTANIIFNGNRLKALLLRSRTRLQRLLSPLLFNLLLKFSKSDIKTTGN